MIRTSFIHLTSLPCPRKDIENQLAVTILYPQKIFLRAENFQERYKEKEKHVFFHEVPSATGVPAQSLKATFYNLRSV